MAINYINTDAYYNWQPGGENHPTQGRRYKHSTRVLQQLENEGVLELFETSSRPAALEELELVHSDEYINQVLIEGECQEWVGSKPDQAEIASLLFGGTMLAVEMVQGGAKFVVNLPGAKHHAMRSYASGFCVFADFAAAGIRFADVFSKRVAILDIDVHHGDGTETLLKDRSDIFTFSVHQKGIFPNTANKDVSDKTNWIFNRPLASGSGDFELQSAVKDFVLAAKEFAPDVIMIAGGADGHHADPLAQLEYTEIGFARAVRIVKEAFADLPIIFSGAGGYCPDDYTPAMWISAILALDGKTDDEIIDLKILERVRTVVSKRGDLYAPEWVSADQEPKELHTEILPGFFMGGTADDDTIDYAKPLSTFEHGIPFDAVVTLYSWAQPMPWGIEELRYGFADANMSHVDEARLHRIAEWAHDRWKEGKRVLVRCQAGMNRSGLVSALVLMRDQYSAEDAIKLLREKRSEVVLFNDAFVDYLVGLEAQN